MSVNVDATGLGNVEILVRQATVDPGSMATTADDTQSAAIADAEIGDYIIPIAPYDMQSIIVTAAVSSANTVDVNFYNASAGTVNLASGTWTFLIIKLGSV